MSTLTNSHISLNDRHSHFRTTNARIDLGRLKDNFLYLQGRAQGAQVWPVVKANAYGHGHFKVAQALEQSNADGICVALVEEGISLRKSGVSLPILILGALTDRQSFSSCIEYKLTPVLHGPEHISLVDEAVALSAAKKLSLHIKLDTGMARLGCPQSQWSLFAQALKSTASLEVAGIMSHLANADAEDEEATRAQTELFVAGIKTFAQAGISPALIHLANSAALLSSPFTHFTMVRPGLGLYGATPFEGKTSELLKPVLSLTTRIVSLRRLEVGQSAGYGSRFVAARPSVIATLPVGYADGLPRALWRRGHTLVHGQRAAFAGTISMDLAMIDITDIAAARAGDEVVLLGQAASSSPGTEPAQACIRVEDWAEWADTIAWEIMTRLSERVPRYYT